MVILFFIFFVFGFILDVVRFRSKDIFHGLLDLLDGDLGLLNLLGDLGDLLSDCVFDLLVSHLLLLLLKFLKFLDKFLDHGLVVFDLFGELLEDFFGFFVNNTVDWLLRACRSVAFNVLDSLLDLLDSLVEFLDDLMKSVDLLGDFVLLIRLSDLGNLILKGLDGLLDGGDLGSVLGDLLGESLDNSLFSLTENLIGDDVLVGHILNSLLESFDLFSDILSLVDKSGDLLLSNLSDFLGGVLSLKDFVKLGDLSSDLGDLLSEFFGLSINLVDGFLGVLVNRFARLSRSSWFTRLGVVDGLSNVDIVVNMFDGLNQFLVLSSDLFHGFLESSDLLFVDGLLGVVDLRDLLIDLVDLFVDFVDLLNHLGDLLSHLVDDSLDNVVGDTLGGDMNVTDVFDGLIQVLNGLVDLVNLVLNHRDFGLVGDLVLFKTSDLLLKLDLIGDILDNNRVEVTDGLSLDFSHVQVIRNLIISGNGSFMVNGLLNSLSGLDHFLVFHNLGADLGDLLLDVGTFGDVLDISEFVSEFSDFLD